MINKTSVSSLSASVLAAASKSRVLPFKVRNFLKAQVYVTKTCAVIPHQQGVLHILHSRVNLPLLIIPEQNIRDGAQGITLDVVKLWRCDSIFLLRFALNLSFLS